MPSDGGLTRHRGGRPRMPTTVSSLDPSLSNFDGIYKGFVISGVDKPVQGFCKYVDPPAIKIEMKGWNPSPGFLESSEYIIITYSQIFNGIKTDAELIVHIFIMKDKTVIINSNNSPVFVQRLPYGLAGMRFQPLPYRPFFYFL